MRLHLKDIFLAVIGTLPALGGVIRESIWVSLGGLAVFLLLLALRLRLKPHRSRDYYYPAVPLLLLVGYGLSLRSVSSDQVSVVVSTLLLGTLYLLIRSLVSRRDEPRADVPLQQNSFLAAVWLSGFLTTYGLYALHLDLKLWPLFPLLGGALALWLLAQSLAYFFLIPPWEFRRESFAIALAGAELIFAVSFWTVSPFFAAAIVMVALYLFWGLVYHQRKSLLTRRLIYEYGVVALLITIFLLAVNRWDGSG